MGKAHRNFFSAIVFAIALIVVPTHARAEPTVPAPGAFRMGMEIEIPRRLMQTFVRNFDWEQVESDIRTSPHLVRYRHHLEKGPLRDRTNGDLVEIALNVAPTSYTYTDGYPPLRKDVAPEVLEATKGLRWHEDGAKMEFSHVTPYDNPAEYVASVLRFAKLFHLDRAIDNPSGNAGQKLSYHIHFSRTDGMPIDHILSSYNRLMLVRMTEAGTAGDLFGGSRMSLFSHDLTERGIIRLVDRDHFELRRHVLPLAEEVTELQKIFGLSQQEGVETVEQMIQERLTPETVKKLIALSPAEAFSVVSISSHFTPPEKRRLTIEDLGFQTEMARAFYATDRPPRFTQRFAARLNSALEQKVSGVETFAHGFFTQLSEVAPQPLPHLFAESPAFSELLSVGRFTCGPSFAWLGGREVR